LRQPLIYGRWGPKRENICAQRQKRLSRARSEQLLSITYSFRVGSKSALGNFACPRRGGNALLLDKLESGIVALETERGSVYVQPTGWQRLYLLWTFRHFSSLPLKTLNSRQRKLVENLPRCGTRRHIDLDRMRVIGTVEGARGLSFDECLTTESAIEAESPNPFAVSVMHSSSPSPAKIQHSSRKEVASSASGSKFISAIAAVVLLAAILIMGWHRLHAARILSRQSDNSAPEATSSANISSETNAASPQAFQPPSADAAQSSASIVVPAIVNSPMPSVKDEPALDSQPVIDSKVENSKLEQPARATYTPNRIKNIPILASVKQSMNDETVPRLQFSGPPSHLIYPSYPETNVRGKVTLKAVIGADGRVRGIAILSGNKMLSAAAKRAVRQWRYAPIYKDGQPVEAETNIAMLFVADDVISISFPGTVLPAQK
jgi:protein TonB